jgi:uncharacterized protein (DUF4415 family)
VPSGGLGTAALTGAAELGGISRAASILSDLWRKISRSDCRGKVERRAGRSAGQAKVAGARVVAQAHRGSEQRWISIGELDNEMIAIVWHVTSKREIHIRINEDVLDWFGQAGRGYQTRINNVLRAFMERRRRAPR